MGNGPSRRQRNEYSMYPPSQPTYSLPPGSYTSLPPPYHHPTRFPPYYSNYNGPIAPPGQFYPPAYSGGHSLPSSTSSNRLAQSSSAAQPVESSSAAPDSQQQQTITIRNAVNIQKNTLRLIKDVEPGFYLLAFSYDADSAGSFNIFMLAKEDHTDGSIKPCIPKAFSPIRVLFEKGFGQKFQQSSGTGIYLDGFESGLLEKESPFEGCPLVIRAQINAKDYPQDSASSAEEDIGAALPKSVNSQVTQAVIDKKDDGECKVRVLRQIIWVDGVRYELKELYGVENTVDRGDYDEEDFGKECVICMSEPRDTAVMPCRHMCMCNGCASSFKSQMNRCPICRQPVESLLKIKISNESTSNLSTTCLTAGGVALEDKSLK